MGRRAGLPKVYKDAEHGDIHRYAFTVHGTRYRGSTGCSDREAAQAEANRIFADALKGRPPERFERVTRSAASQELTHLFARFILSLGGKKSTSYIEKLESHFRAHFAERWASLQDILAPGEIDRYSSDRMAGKAPASEYKPKRPRPVAGSSVTVAKELVTLRRFLKWCKAQRLIDALPDYERVKPISDYRPPAYTPEEARALLAALPDRKTHRCGHAVREWCTAQWAQAFRPGELESLRVCDVDLARREMTVRPSEDKARVGRVISMADETYEIIAPMLQEKRLPTSLLFGRHNYRRALELAAETIGMPRATRHNLRHFRLTELGNSPGTAPNALKSFAGHKHLATTDRYLRSSTQATHDMLAAHKVSRSGTLSRTPRGKKTSGFATKEVASARNRNRG